jgi:hypothetical protein
MELVDVLEELLSKDFSGQKYTKIDLLSMKQTVKDKLDTVTAKGPTIKVLNTLSYNVSTAKTKEAVLMSISELYLNLTEGEA